MRIAYATRNASAYITPPQLPRHRTNTMNRDISLRASLRLYTRNSELSRVLRSGNYNPYYSKDNPSKVPDEKNASF